MADITLQQLEAALEAEGLQLDKDALARAFRKLTRPEGCEHCGQHVKVGTAKGKDIVTACCGTLIQKGGAGK